MAFLKQRLHRKNSSGSYDIIYLETSAELVKRADGTKSVESSLAEIESWDPIKYEENGTVAPFLTTIDADTLEGHPASDFVKMSDTYGKEQILSNATKAAYGLSEDAVPDDAFMAMGGNFSAIDKIGDVKLSRRSDLGDKWLLCNGAKLPDSKYPVLAEMLRSISAGTISRTSSYLYSVYCYNGTWVAVGYNEGGYPLIYTTTNPTGTWTEKNFSSYGYLYGVYCYNGTWVAVGRDNSAYPVIYTTTNPFGTWTAKTLSTSQYTYLHSVIYENGMWVAIGFYANRTFIYTTTDPTGTWTGGQISTSGTSVFEANSIAYYNGIWVAAGQGGGGNYAYVATANDPNGTWTTKQLSTDAVPLQAIACHSGTFVAVGYNINPNNPYVYTTTDPTGTWTEKKIDTSGANLFGVTYCKDKWIAVGRTNSSYPYIYTATDPTGEWALIFNNTSISRLRSVACNNGTFVAVGDDASPYPIACTNAYINLPTISLDGAYAYIKAKE